jgi:large subunit ribosomal protein L4
MTSVDVKNIKGEVVGSFDLDDRVWGIEPNRAVVHQAVVAQLANQRKGTADTKTRGEVRGGTHKMWRQKGTGRARQGDRRAPHWTGGGVVFGPHPRSYHKDFPRKMRRLAMKSALSARLAESALTVVDTLTLSAAKTREVRGALTALGVARSALIVIAEADEAVSRASRNLPEVRAVTPGGLNLLDVLKYRHLILTRPAAEALTEQLLKKISRGRPEADEDEATESGAAVPMEQAAAANAEAGAPADLAVADAAEQVARDRAVETGQVDGASDSAVAAGPVDGADSADEDEKGDA